MRLVKLIADTASIETVRVVDNTYILLLTEEYVQSAEIAEQFSFVKRIDYIRFRKYLKYLADNFWDDLDENNRHICIDNYVKPAELSWEATDYTDPELFAYWVRMVNLEKQCRIERANDCIAKLTWEFTGAQSMQAYNDVFQIIEDWKQCEFPELHYWVNSLAGTTLEQTFDHTADGFASKSYYTESRMNLVNELIFND